jgi:uncharacterized protein (DUF2461 family)
MADSPVAEALKRRSHVVRMKLTQKALGEARLVETIADFAQACVPLPRLGRAAIDEAAPAASRLDRFMPRRA